MSPPEHLAPQILSIPGEMNPDPNPELNQELQPKGASGPQKQRPRLKRISDQQRLIELKKSRPVKFIYRGSTRPIEALGMN